jgi:hypothetical protein
MIGAKLMKRIIDYATRRPSCHKLPFTLKQAGIVVGFSAFLVLCVLLYWRHQENVRREQWEQAQDEMNMTPAERSQLKVLRAAKRD